MRIEPVDDAETGMSIEIGIQTKNLSSRVDRSHVKAGELDRRLARLENHQKRVQWADMDDADIHNKFLGGGSGSLGLQPFRKYHREETLIRGLKERLNHAQLMLAKGRNLMQSMRMELDLCMRILVKEIGEEANVQALLTAGRSSGWKGRERQIHFLKAKITSLQRQLQEIRSGSQLQTDDQDPYDSKDQVHTDDMVPKRQKCVSSGMYVERKELATERPEKRIHQFLDDYQNLDLMYKASTSRNKILTQELKNVQEQVIHFKARKKEDHELIESLMAHQRQLKRVLENEKCVNDQAVRRQQHQILVLEQIQQDDTAMLPQFRGYMCLEDSATRNLEEVYNAGICVGHDLNAGGALDQEAIEKMEYEKYKALYESTEVQKQDLDELVAMLSRRLDEVTSQVIEAKRHCRQQKCQIKDLTEKLSSLMESGQPMVKQEGTPSADRTGRVALLQEQLEVMKEENQFLRTFLQRAVMTKEDDFRLYKSSMDGAKRIYLRSLQEIRHHLGRPAAHSGAPSAHSGSE